MPSVKHPYVAASVVRKIAVTAIVLSLSGTLTAHAGMYKWTDHSGVTHYTQTPPPDSSYQSRTITSAPSPTAQDEAAAQQRLSQDRDDLRAMREHDDERAAREAQEATPFAQAQRAAAQSCQAQIAQVRHMLSGPRITGGPDLRYCWKTSAAGSLANLCSLLAERKLIFSFCSVP